MLVMVLGFVFFDQIWSFVSHPFCSAVINGKTGCRRTGDQLVVSGVFDPFMLRIKIAFFVGLIVSSPVLLKDLGLHRPGPVPAGEALGLPVRGHRGAAVRGGRRAGV